MTKHFFSSWDDPSNVERLNIVFDQKNTAYGAYILRKQNDQRTLQSLFATLAIVGSILFIYKIGKSEETKPSQNAIESKYIITEVNLPPRTQEPTPKTAHSTPKVNRNTTPRVVEDYVEITNPITFDPSKTITDGTIDGTDEPLGFIDGSVLGPPNNGQLGTPTAETNNEIVTIPEEMPSFDGGEEALFKYLNNHLNYPTSAKEVNIQGQVVISFVVDRNGFLSAFEVLRGIGGGCEEEAIRVLKNMPKWKPGLQGGHPVSVRFNLPINFSLK